MISLGGSSSKASSYSTPTTVDVWNEGQRNLWDQLAQSLYYGYASTGYSGVNKYPGMMYVPTTDEEQTYLDSASRIATDLAGVRAGLGDVAYTVNDATTEEYYKNKIEAPTRYAWEKSVKPTIAEQYAGPGYWGSSRADAVTEASKELEMELGSQRANLYYTDEMRKQALASEAANRQAQYFWNYANLENDILGTAGQYSRMIEQEKATGELQRWLMGEGYYDANTGEWSIPTQYNPFLQYMFSALGLSEYAVGTTSTSSSGSSGFNFSIASNILSCAEELKEDFEEIDVVEVLEKLMNLPVKRWKYKFGRGKHIGPMAKEFRESFNVGSTTIGIDTVDAFGVALAAIQGLTKKVQSLEKRLECANANQC